MTDQPPTDDALSYRQAMAELDQLLTELEGSDVDVDRLSQQVQRGVELVDFCRSRLDAVTTEVEGVMADLADADPTPES